MCTILLLLVLTNQISAGFPTFTLFSSESDNKPSDINEMIPLFNLLQKPKPFEKDIKYLMTVLGSNFEPKYTSIHEPSQARDPSIFQRGNIMARFPLMKTVPTMSDELKKLNVELSRGNGEKRKAGSKFMNKLQHWLFDLSKCPVRYKWIDMGENIFPRFIKRGLCSKKKTCSFPSGMKCNPSKWKSINVLLYTCLKDFNSVAKQCRWRPLNVDLLTECACGCHG